VIAIVICGVWETYKDRNVGAGVIIANITLGLFYIFMAVLIGFEIKVIIEGWNTPISTAENRFLSIGQIITQIAICVILGLVAALYSKRKKDK
jgi:amino acid transporter